MLAHQFARLNNEAPVRYMMDPQQAAAIRHYLALHTRAADIPLLHHMEQDTLQPIYQNHPQILSHFEHGLMRSHDEGALIQYLDMLQEHGGIQVPGQSEYAIPWNEQARLVPRLGVLRDMLMSPTSRPAIQELYHRDALNHPSLANILRQFTQGEAGQTLYHHMAGLSAAMPLHQGGQPQDFTDLNNLDTFWRHLNSGRLHGAHALAGLHDIGFRHELAGVPHASSVRSQAGRALRNIVIPHLEDQ